MEHEMHETTRTAVLVAEAPAESPRLRYDNGREVVQEELSSTRRTAPNGWNVGPRWIPDLRCREPHRGGHRGSPGLSVHCFGEHPVLGRCGGDAVELRPGDWHRDTDVADIEAAQPEHRLGLLRHQDFRGDHSRRGRDQLAVAGHR